MFSTPNKTDGRLFVFLCYLKYKLSNKTYYVGTGIFASKKHYNMFLAAIGSQTCLQFQGMPSQIP